MSSQLPFIGRKDELETIQKELQSKGGKIVYIVGEGGVGKTRLIQEIGQRVESQPSFFITKIFDFDDRSISDFENFMLRLAEELKHRGFDIDEYSNALRDLRKMEKANVSLEGLATQKEQAHLILVNVLNRISFEKHIVIILDTVEKSESQFFWLSFIDFFLKINNFSCILAGRHHVSFELRDLLSEKFENNLTCIDLQPLKPEDSVVYLEKKQEATHTNIDVSLIPKLIYLTEGRPILIDLAVEYVARGISLNWLLKDDLDKLRALPEDEQFSYRQEFKKQLVQYITKIRKPIHRLVLMMSRVYPLNVSMIATLLDLPELEAKDLYEDAKSYAFVKEFLELEYITLHDEMRDLVNVFVWTEIDPDNTRRKRDSYLAVNIYENESRRLRALLEEKTYIDTLAAMEEKRLETNLEVIDEQYCKHLVYSNFSGNILKWRDIVNSYRRDRKYIFAKRLSNSAQEFLSSLKPEQQFEYLLLDARLTNDIGDVEDAEGKLLYLLENYGDKDERKSGILNAMGLVEEKLGMLQEALDHQIECLEIVKRLNSRAIAPVSNRVGYLYRLIGDINNADQYYRSALRVNSEFPASERDQSLTASLFNNLGYVCGLERKYTQMDLFCDQAAEIWYELGMEQEIGRSEITRAIFHRDQGNYLSSLELLKQAISRYMEPNDHEQLCRAYFHLGWTQWYVAEKVNELAWDISLIEWDDVALSLALEYFLKSLDLARKYSLKYEIPGIMHQTSSVYWYLGRIRKDESLLQKARSLNHESYEASILVHDYRYAIDSLLGDAEWDYDSGLYERISSHDQKLQSEYGKFRNQYKLYFGRMHRIKADIAFRLQDYETAFNNYAIGLGMIQHHHGFGRYTIQRELLRLSRKLKQLEPRQTREWVNYLRIEWSRLSENQDTELLLGWCDQLELRGLSE